MLVIPRYEPVFVEPNLKEYETQGLQMSMAVDDQGCVCPFLAASLRATLSSRSPASRSAAEICMHG